MSFSFKNFLFGIGAGFIFSSLIFYTVYSLSIKSVENPLNDYTKVVSKAKEYGMVFEKDVKKPEIAVAPRPTETPLAAQAPLPTETPLAETPSPSPTETPQVETPSPSPTETPLVTQSPSPSLLLDTNTVVVTIPSGYSATAIVALLREKEVISDEAEFMKYIRENSSVKALNNGVFTFPKNGDHDKILHILKFGK